MHQVNGMKVIRHAGVDSRMIILDDYFGRSSTPTNDWGAAHVVDRSNRWKERKIKESVYIRTRRTYNMDSGSSLSPVWNSLIRHLEE